MIAGAADRLAAGWDRLARRPLLPEALLVAMIALEWCHVTAYGFMADANWLIVDNPLVLDPPHPLVHFVFQPAFYRPLEYSLYSLWAAIFGASAVWFHLLPIILHALCICLFYRLARVWLRSPGAALASAMVVTMHPMTPMMISYSMGSGPVLAMIWQLLALHAWMRVWNDPARSRRWMFLAVAAHGAAVLCRETALLWPAVLAAWVVWGPRPPTLNGGWRLAQRLVPFVAVDAVWVVLRSWLPVMHFPFLTPHGNAWGWAVLNSISAHFYYLLKSFPFPFPSTTISLQMGSVSRSLTDPGLLVGLLLGLCFAGWLLWRGWPRENRRIWTYGCALAVTMGPTMNWIPLSQLVADRWFYPTLLLMALLVADRALALLRRFDRDRRRLIAALAAVLIFGWGGAMLMYVGNGPSQNYSQVAATARGILHRSPSMEGMQGLVYLVFYSEAERWELRQRLLNDPVGRESAAAQMVLADDAMLRAHGLADSPTYGHSREYWWRESLMRWRQAYDLAPESTAVNLKLGYVLIKRGRAEEAEPHLRNVLERQPHNLDAPIWLAQAAVMQGRYEEALKWLERAGENEPRWAEGIALLIEDVKRARSNGLRADLDWDRRFTIPLEKLPRGRRVPLPGRYQSAPPHFYDFYRGYFGMGY